MAQKAETGPLQIKHGHTETHVLIQFTRPTDHILLTPAQAEDFIRAMRESMAKLEEYLAKKKAGRAPGTQH